MSNIRVGRTVVRQLLILPIDAVFETMLAIVTPLIMGVASMRWAAHLNNHERRG